MQGRVAGAGAIAHNERRMVGLVDEGERRGLALRAAKAAPTVLYGTLRSRLNGQPSGMERLC
ncbi:MAG: hypothetical protein ABI274_15595 [Ktedonobacterales bacterium]